jgi:hypothetical protein
VLRAAGALLLAATLMSTARALGANAPNAILLAAGDVASCSSDRDEQTAQLLDSQAGTIAVLGDAVYERGTVDEFRSCYEPSWGRFRARTRAALGNHEYGSPGAAPARSYFRLHGRGWYTYRLGGWNVVVLNSNCGQIGGCGPRSPQWRWLQARLRENEARCTLAYWHHPRWSSGLHGSDRTMRDLWRLLAAARADVVLAGHDHHYERFAPIDGIRSFVVGTGGRGNRPFLRRLPRSEAASWTTYGVLRLELRDGGYSWRFLTLAGSTFTDAGSGRCR